MWVVEDRYKVRSGGNKIEICEIRFAVVDIGRNRYTAEHILPIRHDEWKGVGIRPVLLGVQGEVFGTKSASHKWIKLNPCFAFESRQSRIEVTLILSYWSISVLARIFYFLKILSHM